MLGPLLGYNKPFNVHKDVRYPVFASYKLDGWRGTWNGVEFMSRTLKTIPNRTLQVLGAQHLGIGRQGWDGEIIIGEPTALDCFNKTDSFCKRIGAQTGEPIRFFAFDNASLLTSFDIRYDSLRDIPPFVVKLRHELCKSPFEVLAMYDHALALGYEGLVLRSPHGGYKSGRSGIREQLMLKMKPKETCECKILRCEELYHNLNPAEIDARGLTKRSSHQSGLAPAGTLGSLVVDWQGRELRVGCFKGIGKDTLRDWWHARDSLPGRYARIEYLPIGMKDLPRMPRCTGIRSRPDLPTELPRQ